MLFDWDPPKHERNERERGFGFDFASLIFGSEVLLKTDMRFDYEETRVKAIGAVEDRVLAVIFTDRADVRWIISARPASRKERREWLQRP